MTQADVNPIGDARRAEGGLLPTWLRVASLRARARLSTFVRPHQILLLGRDRGDTDAVATEVTLAAFSSWCEAKQGSICEIGVSGNWLLLCVAESGTPPDALREQAMLQWEHYHGLDAAQINEQWVLRDLLVPEAAILCAAPRALIDGMSERASLHGVQVRGLFPWWVFALQVWCERLLADVLSAEHSASHQLTLVEPGYLTHVQATIRGQGVQINRIWTEAVDLADPGRVAPFSQRQGSTILRLPPVPPGVQTGDEAWRTCLWCHADLRTLMTDEVFKEARP